MSLSGDLMGFVATVDLDRSLQFYRDTLGLAAGRLRSLEYCMRWPREG